MFFIKVLIFALTFSLASFKPQFAGASPAHVRPDIKFTSIHDSQSPQSSHSSDDGNDTAQNGNPYVHLTVTARMKNVLENSSNQASLMQWLTNNKKGVLPQAQAHFQKKTPEGTKDGYRILLSAGIIDINNHIHDQIDANYFKNETIKDAMKTFMSQLGYRSSPAHHRYAMFFIATFGSLEGIALFHTHMLSTHEPGSVKLSENASNMVVYMRVQEIMKQQGVSRDEAFAQVKSESAGTIVLKVLTALADPPGIGAAILFLGGAIISFICGDILVGIALALAGLIFSALMIFSLYLLFNPIPRNKFMSSHLTNESPYNLTYNPYDVNIDAIGRCTVYPGDAGYNVPGAQTIGYVQGPSVAVAGPHPVDALFSSVFFASKPDSMDLTVLGGALFYSLDYNMWSTFVWNNEDTKKGGCNALFTENNIAFANYCRDENPSNPTQLISQNSPKTGERVNITCEAQNHEETVYIKYRFQGPLEQAQQKMMADPIVSMSSKNVLDMTTPLGYPGADGAYWTLKPVGYSGRLNGTLYPADDQSVSMEFQVSNTDYPGVSVDATLRVRCDPGEGQQLAIAPSIFVKNSTSEESRSLASDFNDAFLLTAPQTLDRGVTLSVILTNDPVGHHIGDFVGF